MRIARVLIVGTLASLLGCQGNDVTKPPTVDGSAYLLKTEPDGGQNVIAARKTSKDRGDVVVVGRIGGSESPFVSGLAAFEIVDPSLKEDIRSAILELLKNDELRKKLVEKGKRNADLYSVKIVANDYVKQYKELTNN